MRPLGFDERWIHLVMSCVRLVQYLVVVNGNSVGNIYPTRGSRQGDPISLYLFIICADALSSLIYRVVDTGIITGIPTSPGGPWLSHLFFADDNLLFCKANLVEWRRLMRSLGVYEVGTRKKLNLQKTSILFSRNTTDVKKRRFLLLLVLWRLNGSILILVCFLTSTNQKSNLLVILKIGFRSG
jgi:hypothetical protein